MDDGVGIRELRQYLSKYLRRVAKGETLQVLDRGRPVAILAPLPEQSSVVDKLVATGRLTRARRSMRDAGPPSGKLSDRLSRALAEQRAEDQANDG